MSIFTGSGVAIVTPFNEQGVNYEVFSKLIDWHIENKTDAIVVCGTTGEASTMSASEKLAVTQHAVKRVNGRIPVIAGTGGNNTADVILQSKAAQDVGADALLVVTPYYNKTTQAGLVAHYNAVGDAVSIPIIVYNVPSRTGLSVEPATMAEMSLHKNVRGMKEASASIEKIIEMTRLCEGRVDFYSGNDDHVVPLMALGFKGVITTVGNIAPREMHELVAMYIAGDHSGSLAMQYRLNPLIKTLFNETNPIPVKTALNLMGWNAGLLRLPLVPMQPKNEATMVDAMKAFGLI